MASKLTSLDISEITRQSDVISKNLRDNYTNLKNKTNELIDEISAVSIGTTNAETTDARPFHTNLKNRLDSIETNKADINGRVNYLKSGGVVTVNATVTKADITELEAKIGGIDVKIAAATTAAIPASAAGNHRVDVIVGNSSNSFIVVTGAESLKASADPIFPSIATTQLSIAALYVDDTGAVDLTNNIYTLKDDNFFPNYYIKQATTINQGIYNFNNLIVDAAITLDPTGTTNLSLLYPEFVKIICKGFYHTTSSGTIVNSGANTVVTNGNAGVTPPADGAFTAGGAGGAVGLKSIVLTNLAPGLGATGGASAGDGPGAGGGGGASIFSAGGAGGASGSDFGAGADVGVAGASANCSIIIICHNADIDGNMTFTGTNGTVGTTGGGGGHGTGGSGGSGGGNVFILCSNDLDINCTINTTGGDGGDGGPINGGAGGGGGSGAVVLIFRSITDSLTHTSAGGGGGTGNGDGSSGSAGSTGLTIKTQYDDLSAGIVNNWLISDAFSF